MSSTKTLPFLTLIDFRPQLIQSANRSYSQKLDSIQAQTLELLPPK
jgi:hypothetical protein